MTRVVDCDAIVFRDDLPGIRFSITVFDGCLQLYCTNSAAGQEKFGSAFVVAQPSRLEGESLPHMTSVLGDDERLTAIAQRLAIKFQQPIWFHADVTAERGDADAVWRFIEKSLVDALKRELATTAP